MPLIEVTVNIRPEKWSKSLHRLTNRSEMAERQQTVHFIPAGSEATSRQQEGARPKQLPRESIFPKHQ